jgi:hypothetical protein
LNAISNQPQVGIDEKKDIGFWIFSIACWFISVALVVYGTWRYFQNVCNFQIVLGA